MAARTKMTTKRTVTAIVRELAAGRLSIDDAERELAARTWRVKPRSDDQVEAYAIADAWMPGDSIDELVNAVRDSRITGEAYARLVAAYGAAPKRHVAAAELIDGTERSL